MYYYVVALYIPLVVALVFSWRLILALLQARRFYLSRVHINLIYSTWDACEDVVNLQEPYIFVLFYKVDKH